MSPVSTQGCMQVMGMAIGRPWACGDVSCRYPTSSQRCKALALGAGALVYCPLPGGQLSH